AAVDPRLAGVRVHRLEADAELPDLGQRLVAARHAADGHDVCRGERPAVVADLEPVVVQGEAQLGGASVLGVLDQLEDEVGALRVQAPEQVQYGRIPAVPRDVLLANLLIIGGHQADTTSRTVWPMRTLSPFFSRCDA